MMVATQRRTDRAPHLFFIDYPLASHDRLGGTDSSANVAGLRLTGDTPQWLELAERSAQAWGFCRSDCARETKSAQHALCRIKAS